jgi:hypothetical protein
LATFFQILGDFFQTSGHTGKIGSKDLLKLNFKKKQNLTFSIFVTKKIWRKGLKVHLHV